VNFLALTERLSGWLPAIGLRLTLGLVFLMGGASMGSPPAEAATPRPAAREGAAGSPAERQGAPGEKEKKKEPIHVTSDRMEADNQKNLIVFIGNVSAIQGEMEIQSDRLEVYVKKREKEEDADRTSPAPPPAEKPRSAGATDSGQEAQGSVERLIAIGNVLINQAKRKFAAGEHLDYKEETGIAVLTGNPRAWEGNNQVSGNKIEIFLKEDRTIVYGSTSRRVNVTLFPDSERPAGPSPPTSRPAKGTNAPDRR